MTDRYSPAPLWTLLAVVLLLLAPATGPLVAQYGGHDYTRIARPELSIEKKPRFDPDKYAWDRYVASGSINRESHLFLNANTIVEAPNAQFPQNESSIAISPLDPDFLIASAVDSRAGAWVYISRDGGASWSNVSLGVVNGTWQSGNDPSVAFDRNGVAYVMYGAFPRPTTGESGVYIARSTDNGETWRSHIPVIEHRGTMTSDSAFEDKYYIEIDNVPSSPYEGWIYTPWKRVTDADSATEIVFTRSTDGGDSWSRPIGISPRKPGTSTHITFGQSFPLVKTGPNGEIYAVWNDGPARSIGFSRSTDGGSTWNEPTYPVSGYAYLGTERYLTVRRTIIDTIDPGGANQRYDTTEVVDTTDRYHVLKQTFRAETYPTIAVDVTDGPRAGMIYLCWAADENPNIYFIRSGDGGATWSTPVIVHSAERNDQWWPWISLDETNGDIAVMYSDSRNDPANIMIDTWVSYSSDGGVSWIDRQATDAMSDFRDNPFVDNIFAGDYSGNAFHDGMVYPSFLDTREDNDVYTAVVNIRAPLPVDSLRVGSRFDALGDAILTWHDPPMETTFAIPLDTFHIEIVRDGVPIAELAPDVERFVDEGRTLDVAYDYEVTVVAGEQRSVAREVTFVAGSARLPGIPQVVAADRYGPSIDIDLLLPSTRADSVTPLGNLAALRVYRDGDLLEERSLALTDTGRVVSLEDLPEKGYYRFRFSVVDAEGNEGELSEETVVYAGDFETYVLLEDRPYRLLLDGEWAYTDEIAYTGTLSLTDRPDADYQSRVSSSAQLFPVIQSTNLSLRFQHIAIVRSNDSAVVEYSVDSGRTWVPLATYSMLDHDEWSDGSADPEDWKWELIDFPINPGPEIVLLRFRLSTGIFGNDQGWFIDDVGVIVSPNSVEERSTSSGGLSATVYPNPTRTTPLLSLRSREGGEATVRIVDHLGRSAGTDLVWRGVLLSGETTVVRPPVEITDQGVYFLVVEHRGVRSAYRFVIHR